MEEIAKREASHGRVYSEEEIWIISNIFWTGHSRSTLCEKAVCKDALHPNDPPACLCHGSNRASFTTAMALSVHLNWLETARIWA